MSRRWALNGLSALAVSVIAIAIAIVTLPSHLFGHHSDASTRHEPSSTVTGNVTVVLALTGDTRQPAKCLNRPGVPFGPGDTVTIHDATGKQIGLGALDNWRVNAAGNCVLPYTANLAGTLTESFSIVLDGMKPSVFTREHQHQANMTFQEPGPP
jgi:hypothetical protein